MTDGEWRRRIREERDGLRRLLADMERDGLGETQGESLGEVSVYDNHPADIGTETWERSKDLALWRQLRGRVAALEEAERRLDEGTYGRCRLCGAAIPVERLMALPEADLCVPCAGRLQAERGERLRPLEEESLSPPFGRSFRDGGTEGHGGNVMYDGEDAWQDVARYGTSDSPQDVPGSRDYRRLYYESGERRGAVTDEEVLLDEEGEPLDTREGEEP